MRVTTDPAAFDPSTRPVMAFGIFDGVHLGHRALISLLNRSADQRGTEPLLVTFWPHPRLVLGKAPAGFRLLNTLEEKMHLLEEAGARHLMVIPFNQQFAGLPADHFIREILHGRIRPQLILAGEDVRFGADAAGNRALLSAAGKTHGWELQVLEPLIMDGERISSSRIRDSLLSADLETANRLLGCPYRIEGRVGAGKQIGRSIGFPTANIDCCRDLKLVPADGVYAVLARIGDETRQGMLNIGVRPTLAGEEFRTIEVHLFGLNRDLYGETLRISLVRRLRDEMKFPGLEALRDQLERDRLAALDALANG